jgi:transposase InsO family protein
MRTSLICDAVSMAAARGSLEPDAVFHSDRGSQYQCRLVNDSEAVPHDIRSVAS